VEVMHWLANTSGHRHSVRQARANGATTRRSATTFGTKRAAGAWSSTCPSRTTVLAQVATVQQNGLLSHPQDLDTPLRLAAQRKIHSFSQRYADNQNISFLPTIVFSPSACTANFGVFFFYRPTGRPSSPHRPRLVVSRVRRRPQPRTPTTTPNDPPPPRRDATTDVRTATRALVCPIYSFSKSSNL
jgi:hypothetical protein